MNTLHHPRFWYLLCMPFLFLFSNKKHSSNHKPVQPRSIATIWADTQSLKEGDLLFQDLNCGPLCDAIEEVTPDYHGMHFSHVGILHFIDNKWVVIEAYDGVGIVSLSQFLNRSKDSLGKPLVRVGRLKPAYQSQIALAMINAYGAIGLPYDDDFLPNNGKYYCSEFVRDVFVNDRNDTLFSNKPMTYKRPGESAFQPVWAKYFEDKKQAIPQGVPGINPGLMTKSDKIQMLSLFE